MSATAQTEGRAGGLVPPASHSLGTREFELRLLLLRGFAHEDGETLALVEEGDEQMKFWRGLSRACKGWAFCGERRSTSAEEVNGRDAVEARVWAVCGVVGHGRADALLEGGGADGDEALTLDEFLEGFPEALEDGYGVVLSEAAEALLDAQLLEFGPEVAVAELSSAVAEQIGSAAVGVPGGMEDGGDFGGIGDVPEDPPGERQAREGIVDGDDVERDQIGDGLDLATICDPDVVSACGFWDGSAACAGVGRERCTRLVSDAAHGFRRQVKPNGGEGAYDLAGCGHSEVVEGLYDTSDDVIVAANGESAAQVGRLRVGSATEGSHPAPSGLSADQEPLGDGRGGECERGGVFADGSPFWRSVVSSSSGKDAGEADLECAQLVFEGGAAESFLAEFGQQSSPWIGARVVYLQGVMERANERALGECERAAFALGRACACSWMVGSTFWERCGGWHGVLVASSLVMLFKGKRTKRRASELFGVVYASEQAPLDEMAELITLGRAHAAVKDLLIEQLLQLVHEGGDDRGVCWLLVVAGELGREGDVVVMSAGRGDDPEVLCRVIVPVLSRHAAELLPVLLRWIHQSEEASQRKALYLAVEGALLSEDEDLRARLAVFAMERLCAEMEDPDGWNSLCVYPLRLLREVDEVQWAQALRRQQDGTKKPSMALARLELDLRRDEYLDDVRSYAAQDWRELARSL